MDSSESPTYGAQEGSSYNGHFGCTCYHPLFVFNQLGDLERCALRSWALRDLPDGRGCGVSSDVPGNPIADRAAAGTARAGMTRRSEQMRRTTRAEVRPDEGRATRLSASARSTGDFDHLPCTPHTICRCSRRPKGRAWPHNDPESGECRFNTPAATRTAISSSIRIRPTPAVRTKPAGLRITISSARVPGRPRGALPASTA